MKKTLLAVFAHPDDETFGTGGSLCLYAAKGYDVYLVCATRGEAGEIAGDLATPETLGQVREAELRCAAAGLGIKDVIFLGYRDSGMAGSTDNQHPNAFCGAKSEEVVPRLVEIFRRLKPSVVVTFEPNGGYGHPDHIAAHRHTVAAFHAAADPSCHQELGAAWQADRLYYTAIPRSFFINMAQRLKEMGVDTSEFEHLGESMRGWPDEEVHVILDVSRVIDAKWDAFFCHRTQIGPDHLFRQLPDAEMKQFMSREYFALAYPQARPGLKMTDLFEGL